jgi:hypothetical protein
MIPDPLEDFEQTAREMNEYMHKHNRTVFGRYPLLFSFLATFGVVCVLYGFENILNEIPLMEAYPVIPLLVGVLILLFTGTLYKRIEKKFD